MTKNEKNEIINNNAVACILKYFEKKDNVTRKAVLDGASDSFYKMCTQKKISGIGKSDARSYVGKALTDLIAAKTLCNKDGKIFKEAEDNIIVDKAQCKTKLLELLKQKEYSKTELFTLIIRELGADQTKSKKDDNEIKGYIGQLLSEYLAENTIELKDNKYSVKNKPAGKRSAKPMSETDFKKAFLERLHENGGSFFERFFANVLEKYYTLTGRTVWDCNVSGGNDDGGIDIRIKISDDLGFVDNIMLQTKCRQNIQVTENEIRNFYGAINVVKASRGIFVTTSTFHPSADKLLHSLDNCVGVDGNGVFDLSKKVLYGMKISKNGYVFDDRVFDI